MQPVFRFAPSPNGLLHLGHALSALLNADAARRMAGRLLLRIEDIDPERSRETFVAALLEDLDWIGFGTEEPVLRQSRRMDLYRGRLDDLRRRGLVYRCFCSRGFTAWAVAEHEKCGRTWPRDPDGAPFHAGPCHGLDEAASEARAAAGEPHTWRLRMASAIAAVPCELPWIALAEDTFAPTERRAAPARWGDAVLARRDVPTSYHLAVVIDDAAQGVTHVVRGRDLEPATDLHRLLQALLGLPTPLYCHHRLLLGPDGQKLAKSAGSTALRDLRAAGWTPADVRRAVGLQAPGP